MSIIEEIGQQKKGINKPFLLVDSVLSSWNGLVGELEVICQFDIKKLKWQEVRSR